MEVKMKKVVITSLFLVCLASSANADISRIEDSVLKCLSYSSRINCETARGEVENYIIMYANEENTCGYASGSLKASLGSYMLGGRTKEDIIWNLKNVKRHCRYN